MSHLLLSLSAGLVDGRFCITRISISITSSFYQEVIVTSTDTFNPGNLACSKIAVSICSYYIVEAMLVHWNSLWRTHVNNINSPQRHYLLYPLPTLKIRSYIRSFRGISLC